MKTTMTFRPWIFLLAAFLAAPTLAEPPELGPAIDALFAGWTGPDTPGCAIGLIEDGRWVYKAAYGLANLEDGVPLTTRSVFRIASTSKQFTAFVVMRLAERGVLGLDDEVRRYVPELPPREPPVLVRHLLDHTSGYREYLDLMELRGREHYTPEEALAVLVSQEEHNFPAGQWHVNNDSGYFLLSIVVHRATGKTLRQLADEEVFAPLGMAQTHFHDDHREIVPHRAVGYSPVPGGGFRIDETILDIVGDGGVFTTVEDLFLWLDNLADPKVGSRELFARMTEPVVFGGGERIGHGKGLMVTEYRGLKKVAHSGSFAGFRADTASFPDQGVSVVVLCNRGDARPWDLGQKAANLLLGDRLAPPGPAPDPDELAALTGRFADVHFGRPMELVAEDGGLVAVFPWGRRVAFRPLGGRRFVTDAPGLTWLEVVGEGEARSVRYHIDFMGHLVVYRPAAAFAPPAAASEAAGTYHCDEVPARIELTADGPRLRLRRPDPRLETLVLDPWARDHYGTGYWSVELERDAEGRVRGLRLGASRARNLRCLKRP